MKEKVQLVKIFSSAYPDKIEDEIDKFLSLDDGEPLEVKMISSSMTTLRGDDIYLTVTVVFEFEAKDEK